MAFERSRGLTGWGGRGVVFVVVIWFGVGVSSPVSVIIDMVTFFDIFTAIWIGLVRVIIW
ncbi:hypothetical protein JOM56_005176 [Amanita muscaria]